MLIFDMDGTLIDSNGIWRQVDEAFLAKRGYPYTREYYEGVAHTIFPMAAKFTKAYCHLEESEEKIMAEWMQMAGDAYAVRVPIKPGVREYLDRCRTAGERMIVLTSSVPEHCRAALGRLGLTEYFERILFAHDLGMDKKDPETFRHAAALMGVTPEPQHPAIREIKYSISTIPSFHGRTNRICLSNCLRDTSFMISRKMNSSKVCRRPEKETVQTLTIPRKADT